MRKLFLAFLAAAGIAFAQPTVPLSNVRIQGTNNQINSASSLLAASGGTLGISNGGTFTFNTSSLFSGDAPAFRAAIGAGTGTGSVTSVSVVTANGVSGTVATATTTPAITLTLGAITPTTVNGLTISPTSGTLSLANSSTHATVGAFTSTFTFTGTTGVTFPTSGTLATTGGSVPSIQGTANQVLVNGTSGSPVAGSAITLTTPQNIATTSSPTFANLTDSGLTAGRVTFAGTSGILSDDSDLTFATDTLTFTKGIAPTSLLVGTSTAPSLNGSSSAFTLVDTAATLPRGISNVQYSTDANSANFSGYKANGTQASPLIVAASNVLTNLRAWGYDGTNTTSGWLNMGSLRFRVPSAAVPAATSVPTEAVLSIGSNATPSALTDTGVFSSTTGITLTPIGVTNVVVSGGKLLVNTATSTTGPGNNPQTEVLSSGSDVSRNYTTLSATSSVVGRHLFSGQNASSALTDYASAAAVIIANTAAAESGALAFRTRNAGTLAEAARFTNLGNLLIGGTTDITGSGGLKVFGSTAATGTTSGSLQVAGGAGIAGAIFGGSTLSLGTNATNNVIECSTSTAAAGVRIINSAVGGPYFIADPTNATLGNRFAGLIIRQAGTDNWGFQIRGSTDLVIHDFVNNTNPINVTLGAISASKVTIAPTTTSTSTTTGGLVVSGGAGIAGALFVGTSGAAISGGAGNMTITSGTGNSRTMTLQTTTSGGTATTFMSADATQNITVSNKITSYNGIATAGNGVVTVQGAGRVTAQVAANASVATYTLPATDASFEVSANVLVTTSSAEAFTVTCAYTSEDNTSRTITLNFQLLAGTIGTAINFANGAVPYEGIPVHIRCKASTAITVATVGTFTGSTYNVEGVIRKLQ